MWVSSRSEKVWDSLVRLFKAIQCYQDQGLNLRSWNKWKTSTATLSLASSCSQTHHSRNSSPNYQPSTPPIHLLPTPPQTPSFFLDFSLFPLTDTSKTKNINPQHLVCNEFHRSLESFQLIHSRLLCYFPSLFYNTSSSPLPKSFPPMNLSFPLGIWKKSSQSSQSNICLSPPLSPV